MRVGKCVPMIALCLLLCSCGRQEEKKADLRAAYQDMTGCEMTAEVSCDQSGLEWSATLRGTYAPGGESTVEVLEPLDLAGVRAALREDGWTLEYGDLCLNAGTLSRIAGADHGRPAERLASGRKRRGVGGCSLHPAGAGADRDFRGRYGDHRLASADRRHSPLRRDCRGRQNNFAGTVYELCIL